MKPASAKIRIVVLLLLAASIGLLTGLGAEPSILEAKDIQNFK